MKLEMLMLGMLRISVREFETQPEAKLQKCLSRSDVSFCKVTSGMETHIDPDGVHEAVDLNQGLCGVHLAKEVVQHRLRPDNLAVLVAHDAPEDLREVLVGHKQTTVSEFEQVNICMDYSG